MTAIRSAYLKAAASAVRLLGGPAVEVCWREPSALRDFAVSGLAGHLARQVTTVSLVLGQQIPAGQAPITLLDHYARVPWIGADLDDEINLGIRSDSESSADGGPAATAERARAALEMLQQVLPAEAPDRMVQVPWGPWSLSLDDFLTTRLMEIAVHSDDLAYSVGIEAPELPPAVIVPVLTLLSQLAARAHGQAAVLRALSRAERAPASIAAF